MSTAVVPHPPSRSSAARNASKWVAWGAILALAAYFFAITVPNYFHYDAAHYRYYWPKRWWLIAHISGGTLALALGPIQFSSRLRKRYVQAHRWLGRLYLLAILVGTIGAAYMGIFVSPLKVFGWSLEALALAWFTTALMAFISVKRRQFALHREWMIRSYVMTFSFVLFRVGSRNHVFGSLGPEMAPVMLAWVVWAVPFLFTDVVLRWPRLARA